jgi:hypothetical protein
MGRPDRWPVAVCRASPAEAATGSAGQALQRRPPRWFGEHLVVVPGFVGTGCCLALGLGVVTRRATQVGTGSVDRGAVDPGSGSVTFCLWAAGA